MEVERILRILGLGLEKNDIKKNVHKKSYESLYIYIYI